MAKGQKRSSRETRKPKAEKPVIAAAATSMLSRGSLNPIDTKKK